MEYRERMVFVKDNEKVAVLIFLVALAWWFLCRRRRGRVSGATSSVDTGVCAGFACKPSTASLATSPCSVNQKSSVSASPAQGIGGILSPPNLDITSKYSFGNANAFAGSDV